MKNNLLRELIWGAWHLLRRHISAPKFTSTQIIEVETRLNEAKQLADDYIASELYAYIGNMTLTHRNSIDAVHRPGDIATIISYDEASERASAIIAVKPHHHHYEALRWLNNSEDMADQYELQCRFSLYGDKVNRHTRVEVDQQRELLLFNLY